MKLISLVAVLVVVLVAGGCTLVKYTDGDKSLLIADVRISGSAIDLSAALEGKGTLEVNREQGSVGSAAAEVIGAAADAGNGQR